MKTFHLLLLTALSNLASAVPAGDYWITRFNMPDGIRSSIQIETNELEVETGDLSIAGNGTIGGSAGGDPFTGNATALANERVDLMVTTSGESNAFTTYSDLSETLLVGQVTEVDDANDLLVLPKKPSSASNVSVAGEWAFVSLETPSFVGSNGENSGNVGVSVGTAGFNAETGSVTFDFEVFGDFDSGSESGSTTYAVRNDGLVQLTGLGDFYLNSGFDFIVNVQDDPDGGDDFQEVVMLAKKPTNASISNLVGVWRIFSMEVSRVNDGTINDTVSLDFDGRVELVNIVDNGNNTGFLTSQEPDGPQGAPLSITPSGTITVSATTGNVSAFLAEGKEVFIFAVTDRSTFPSGNVSNDYEIAVAVKTTSPFNPISFTESVALQISYSPEGLIELNWNDEENRVLQVRDSLTEGDWRNVDDSGGSNSFTEPGSTRSRFYRVIAE